MDAFLFACACIGALVIFDLLAIRFGIDSRPGFRDEDRRPPLLRGS